MKMKLNQNSILLLSLIILVVCSCKHSVNRNLNLELKEKLNSLIEGKTDSLVLDVAKITNFAWEKLYVFKPYTSVASIDSILGFQWEEAKESKIDQSDGFNLLVFVENNTVKHAIQIPRNNGDFIKLKSSGPFYNHSASFIVKKVNYGEQPWLFFYEK